MSRKKTIFYISVFFIVINMTAGNFSNKPNILIYLNFDKIEKSCFITNLINELKLNSNFSRLFNKYSTIKKQLKTPDSENNNITFFTAIITIPSNTLINYNFSFFLEHSISKEYLYKICQKIFSENYDDYIIIEKGQGGIIIKNPKNHIFLELKNNGRVIVGRNDMENKVAEIKNIDSSEFNDIKDNLFIKIIIPDWLKKDILKNQKQVLKSKDALPTDFNFINGLNLSIVKVNFTDKITVSLSFYFLDSKHLLSFKVFIEQYLPLLKFEIMTLTKGKALKIINRITPSYNYEENIVSLTTYLKSEELSEIITNQKKQKQSKE